MYIATCIYWKICDIAWMFNTKRWVQKGDVCPPTRSTKQKMIYGLRVNKIATSFSIQSYMYSVYYCWLLSRGRIHVNHRDLYLVMCNLHIFNFVVLKEYFNNENFQIHSVWSLKVFLVVSCTCTWHMHTCTLRTNVIVYCIMKAIQIKGADRWIYS